MGHKLAMLLAAAVTFAVPAPTGLSVTVRGVGPDLIKVELGWAKVGSASSYLYRVDGGAAINTTARTATITLTRSEDGASHTYCVAARAKGGVLSPWSCATRSAPKTDSLRARLFAAESASYASGSRRLVFAEFGDSAWVCAYRWIGGKVTRDAGAVVGVVSRGGGVFDVVAISSSLALGPGVVTIPPGVGYTVNLPPPLPAIDTRPLPTTFVNPGNYASSCLSKLMSSLVWASP